MAVHTVQGDSLVRRAMDAVNSHIRSQSLRVGDSLPGEGHFAEELGVSRAVMREAFGALAALRLIDVGNGRKPRVAAIDGSVMATSLDHAIGTAQINVVDVWDVRRTLEVRTAALAAANRTQEQAAEIVELAEMIAENAANPDLIKKYDIAFHQAIAAAAGNGLLTAIIRSFGPLMEVAVPAAWKTRTTPEQRAAIIKQHRELAAAIAVGDADRAAECMNQHFDESVAAKLASETR
jgi:DNA-binding FadR family transcriptional regulator